MRTRFVGGLLCLVLKIAHCLTKTEAGTVLVHDFQDALGLQHYFLRFFLGFTKPAQYILDFV